MENRWYRRRKAIARGRLVLMHTSETISVTIRDLSDSGARVAVPDGCKVPAEAYLIELESGKAHEAAVVWRRSREIGLDFRRSLVLDATTPRDLSYLRQVWMREA